MAFRERVRSGGGAAVRPFREPANVSRPRQRHGVRSREIGDPSIAPSQMRQDPPPGGIGQRGERSAQGARIFNHLVKY